jgi:hypothetical protein
VAHLQDLLLLLFPQSGDFLFPLPSDLIQGFVAVGCQNSVCVDIPGLIEKGD